MPTFFRNAKCKPFSMTENYEVNKKNRSKMFLFLLKSEIGNHISRNNGFQFHCSCEKKELKSGINGREFRKEYLDSYGIATVYFTGDKDAKERIRSLNDLDKNDLNKIRRSSEDKDGIFNDCQ